MKNNYTLGSHKESMGAENWNLKLPEKVTEKSSLVGLIDYFRILKALMILFLLYIYRNYVPNQNEKVQEETLADSNSEALKTETLRYFKRNLPLFQVFQKSLPTPLSLCHIE